ncbi:hypothetical protein PAMA_000337 [Pampus argenteus]
MSNRAEDLMTKPDNMSLSVAQNTEVDCESSGGVQCFPELRMVLLGLHRSGKSSTGNTILGSSKFGEWTVRTYQKEEAEVAGRRLVVIDTPPWLKASGMSPDQNIVNWVCQCPPGPHALIFVLNLSTKFTTAQWKFAQRYMELLGERAWNHVIVLFTGADIIEGMSVTSYLRNKGPSLQNLLEKCGNRHFFFNNRNRSHSSTQVTDLLEGIERLSSEHNPGFYKMDTTITAAMEENNQALSVKAEKRCQKVAAKERARRVIFRDGKAHKLLDMRIVLLGDKWSGKTYVAKTMAPWDFREEKTKCVATETVIDHRYVLIVDTPGWFTHAWRQLTKKQETITDALSLCHPGPHALLIVVSLKSNFTDNHRQTLEQNLACLSDTMWRNAMVLFTFGEKLQGETIETHIENEGEALHWLVEKCDHRYHVFSDTPFNDFPQVKELLRRIDEMVEANSGQYFHNLISQIHSESSKSRNDLMDDEDFKYTPREEKMMERMMEMMMEKIQERLPVFIKNYAPKGHLKDERSNPHSRPDSKANF